MAQSTAGLTSGGLTTHYQISYESTLSKGDGQDRANALIARCEDDFSLMRVWFEGIDPTSYPIGVLIDNGAYGGTWSGSPIQVKIGPGGGSSVDVIRYLLVTEVTEIFMRAQNKGWFEASNEGSKGQGLSRFLGIQFQLANGLGDVAPTISSGTFAVTNLWLNSARPNAVDTNIPDNTADAVTGCTTLFLFYLRDQLGISVRDIVAAGGATLADVYQNLRHHGGGWTEFIYLVNRHYPSGAVYNPVGESVFPVSEVGSIVGPGYITAGYGGTVRVILDKPARAEVLVTLTSIDASVVVVPPTVTVLPGRIWTDFPVTTSPIRVPFRTREVTIFASSGTRAAPGEWSVTGTVKLRPVRVVQAQFVPASVKCGDTTTLTVTLDHASLLGDVEVTLVNEAPGFIETIPASVTIPQGQLSAQVTAVTHDVPYPVKTAHVSVLARYLDNSWGDAASAAEAELEIKSRVPGGVLKSIVVVPSHITGGRTANGTVTLEEAVAVPTDVGLAALEPGHPGLLPLDPSSAASVPASVAVPENGLSAPFVVETVAPSRGVIWSAVIMANAVVTKTTTITIG